MIECISTIGQAIMVVCITIVVTIVFGFVLAFVVVWNWSKAAFRALDNS